jgi:competence protein ComFB
MGVAFLNSDRNFQLRNHMESVVNGKLNEMLKKGDFCKCDVCRMDMMAYALNLLEPKYVVTDKGDLYSRLEEFTPQAEIDVEIALTEAIKVISKNPRHK